MHKLRPNSFCGNECRIIFYRNRRGVAAKGVCLTCQGSTTKKTYKQCQACRWGGVPLPTSEVVTPEPTERVT